MPRLFSRFASLVLLAAAPLVAGCPNPNTYGTPRTLNPGKVQHTIALEGVGVLGAPDPVPNFVLPTLPTYQLRVGVADGFDIGVRAAQLSSLGADFKWNFLRSAVDLAIDPGFQVGAISAGGNTVAVFYGHMPLLVGFNVTDWFTIHLTPGLLFVAATSSVDNPGQGADAFASASGVAARGGLGLQFRVSDGFAVTPEFTLMRGFGDGEGFLVNAGLGFSFGAMPDYSDLSGGAAQPGPGGAAPAAR